MIVGTMDIGGNYCIRHKGGFSWHTSMGRTSGGFIWPIGEYLDRTRHSPRVGDRIERLNPDGKIEGGRPRGWHPSSMFRHKGKRSKSWR